MSQLIRLRGKDTLQCAHCTLQEAGTWAICQSGSSPGGLGGDSTLCMAATCSAYKSIIPTFQVESLLSKVWINASLTVCWQLWPDEQVMNCEQRTQLSAWTIVTICHNFDIWLPDEQSAWQCIEQGQRLGCRAGRGSRGGSGRSAPPSKDQSEDFV